MLKVNSFLLCLWIISADATREIEVVEPWVSYVPNESSINFRPIIGILSQELHEGMTQLEPAIVGNFSSYIASSYVKFVEAAGARVVPILINQPDAYYEKLAKSLNGFLFPGGATAVDQRSGYGRAGKKMYTLSLEHGARGTPIPLWGTCLGFEMLTFLLANGTDLTTHCLATNLASTLEPKPDYRISKLFKKLPDHLLIAMQTTSITSNFHSNCLTPQSFVKYHLDDSVLLLTTSEDSQGLDYVSTFEHKTLPIFGTQWHPEKAPFEWAYDKHRDSIPHDLDAIRLSQYLGETFVQQARNNLNHFSSEDEASEYLIYNYQAVFLHKSPFQQCYFFK